MNKLKSILTDTLYVGLGSAIIITRTAVKVANTCRHEGRDYLKDRADKDEDYMKYCEEMGIEVN